jgi:hypothetical protein
MPSWFAKLLELLLGQNWTPWFMTDLHMVSQIHIIVLHTGITSEPLSCHSTMRKTDKLSM